MKKWPTEAELRRLCAKWQELLRLQNWKVEVSYARTRAMVGEDGDIAWGHCAVNANHMRAKIQVLHPNDYFDDDGRNDIEATLVHELLHILMDGIRREIKSPPIASDTSEEQAINVLAELLVKFRQTVEIQ